MIIVHTESSPGLGGQELRILLEAGALTARGHRVIIAASPQGRLLSEAARRGLPCAPIAFRGRSDLASLVHLRRLLLRERADILNTHSAIDGWVGALATRHLPAQLAHLGVVRTRHLSIAVKRNLPTRWVYTRGCDAIVTTGQALRRTLIDVNGFAGTRIVSVPTGVDLSRFDPGAPELRHAAAAVRAEFGIAADAPLIGVIAMLRRMKGHDVLLHALPRIVAAVPQARVLCVGEIPPGSGSPVRDELTALAQRLGIADRVIFAGFRSDIPAVLAACDAVTLPSLRDEGVPQGLSQALAMARPVVATAVGAVGEIVREGDTGWLVPPGDAAALATALSSALTDRATATARAAAGRSLIATRYSVSAMADAMERVFAAVTAAKRARIPVRLPGAEASDPS